MRPAAANCQCPVPCCARFLVQRLTRRPRSFRQFCRLATDGISRSEAEGIVATMATFVVAHGAWSAGWAWKKMRPLMRAAGHELWAPTYTGLGERAHLGRAAL